MDLRLNKSLLLITVKYIPCLIGIIFIIQNILLFIGIYNVILVTLCNTSIIPLVSLCLFSKLLGFCIWNRLPLYIPIAINLINLIDFYFPINLTIKLILNSILFILLITFIIGAIYKNYKNANKRNIKTDSTQ